MANPERIIITPQGVMDSPAEAPSFDLLPAITWLALITSVVGDLTLAFHEDAALMHAGFGALTAISALLLAKDHLPHNA